MRLRYLRKIVFLGNFAYGKVTRGWLRIQFKSGRLSVTSPFSPDHPIWMLEKAQAEKHKL